MEKTGKRERSVNFTLDETELLISLAATKKHIFENKKSDAATWKEKEAAWKHVEKAFNTCGGAVFRDSKNLKLKYEGLKRDTRKKCAILAEQCDGPAPVLTPLEKKFKELILLPLEGNESFYDSPSTSNHDTSFPEHMAPDIDVKVEIQEDCNDEPPEKKKFQPLESEGDSDENLAQVVCEHVNGSQEWNPVRLRTKKHLLYKSREKKQLDKLETEKIESVRLQNQLLKEEIEMKAIQRVMLKEELDHKSTMHKLEEEHLRLKIQLLKAELNRQI